jgi:SAM-dependent methyltransferase
MRDSAMHRYEVLKTMFPGKVPRLLEVGCGAIGRQYRFADYAEDIVCNDWRLRTPRDDRASGASGDLMDEIPKDITLVPGHFLKADIGKELFDVVILADVLEHIQIEEEQQFVNKLISCLRPGGSLLISVPHRGSFSYLDPLHVKPAIHHILWRFGLRKGVHNGMCDVRKLHKHYRLEDLQELLYPLQCCEVQRWGYFWEPLDIWAKRIRSKLGRCPGEALIHRYAEAEHRQDFGERSYHLAARFIKPVS